MNGGERYVMLFFPQCFPWLPSHHIFSGSPPQAPFASLHSILPIVVG